MLTPSPYEQEAKYARQDHVQMFKDDRSQYIFSLVNPGFKAEHSGYGQPDVTRNIFTEHRQVKCPESIKEVWSDVEGMQDLVPEKSI